MTGDVLVLCYHAVSERWQWKFAVDPSRLIQQVSYLLERGYRPATFHEAVTAAPAAKTFAVTFDDAFRSVADAAFPLLERVGVPATVFAVANYVGTNEPMAWPGLEEWLGGPFEEELAAATWDDLRRLADAGWEVASHTCSHPPLTTVAAASLAEELENSRRVLEERLGVPCRSIAYPYGDADARVLGAVRAAGYRAGAAFPPRFPTAHALEWPRVGVYRGDGPRHFALKVSPRVRRIRSSRVWPLARGLHRAVERVRAQQSAARAD